MQKVTVDGQVYEYDDGKLMMSEAFDLYEKTGQNLVQWNAGLQAMNPHSVKGLIYLLKKRAGENPDYATLDFDLGGLSIDGEGDEQDGPKEPSDT